MSEALHTLGTWELLMPFWISVGLAGVAALAARGRPDTPVVGDVGGIVAVGAAAFAIDRGGDLLAAGWLVVALVALALGALLTAQSTGVVLGVAGAVPGAVVLGIAASRAGSSTESAIAVAVVACVTVHALARSDVDWRGTGLGPALAATTAAGAYVCTPETGHTLPVFAAAGGVAVVAIAVGTPRLGALGTGAIVGLVLWAGAIDGSSRSGAVVAVGACGLATAVEWFVRRWNPRAPSVTGRRGALAALVVVAVAVLLLSRVAGLVDSAPVATAIAVPVLVLLAVGLGRLAARPAAPAHQGST